MWMESRSCSSRPTLDLLGVVIGMIEISNLIKEYSGKRVVDIQSLQVDPGELFGFLGPNGAGKTTTIRILTTLTKPTSGRALINGSDVVRDLSKVKLEFGIVQQHLSLNKDLTIAENLESFMQGFIICPKHRERKGYLNCSIMWSCPSTQTIS